MSIQCRRTVTVVVTLLSFSFTQGCAFNYGKRPVREIEKIQHSCEQKKVEVDGRRVRPTNLQVRFTEIDGARSEWTWLCGEVDVGATVISYFDGDEEARVDRDQVRRAELRKNGGPVVLAVILGIVIGIPVAYVLGAVTLNNM